MSDEGKRKRNNSPKKTKVEANRGLKRICIPIEQDDYQAIVDDPRAYRLMLDEMIGQYPAIFPAEIGQGYKLNGWTPSSQKMPDVRVRRIALHSLDKAGKQPVYNLAPSLCNAVYDWVHG